MQYAFPLNKPYKKKKPGKQKLVGQKAALLFFHPTKECLQFLYIAAAFAKVKAHFVFGNTKAMAQLRDALTDKILIFGYL